MVVDLPAPLGPEKAEELARGNCQVDTVDGGQIPEAPRKSLRHDGCVGHRFSHFLDVVRNKTLT